MFIKCQNTENRKTRLTPKTADFDTEMKGFSVFDTCKLLVYKLFKAVSKVSGFSGNF